MDMAKRGERRPWRVAYQWSNGVKGTDTFGSEAEAQHHADVIRGNGERRDDTDVTVAVTRRAAS